MISDYEPVIASPRLPPQMVIGVSNFPDSPKFKFEVIANFASTDDAGRLEQAETFLPDEEADIYRAS